MSTRIAPLTDADIERIEESSAYERRYALARRLRRLEAATADYKASVFVAATGNVDLAQPVTNIDGQTVRAGKRVLLWLQSDAKQNGIYVRGTDRLLTRADDGRTADLVTTGLTVYVESGTNKGRRLTLTTEGAIVPGSTPLTFEEQGGSSRWNVRVVTADAGLAPGDDVVLCTGPLTLTLYDPAGRSGERHTVKSIGDGLVTLVPAVGQVEFGASFVLASKGDTAPIVTDGTDWYVV